MGNHPDSIRLNKAISDSGYCSRRKADVFIEQGRVTLNGSAVSLGDRAMPGDLIHVDGHLITKNTNLVYIALNKPVDITLNLKKKICLLYKIKIIRTYDSSTPQFSSS